MPLYHRKIVKVDLVENILKGQKKAKEVNLETPQYKIDRLLNIAINSSCDITTKRALLAIDLLGVLPLDSVVTSTEAEKILQQISVAMKATKEKPKRIKK